MVVERSSLPDHACERRTILDAKELHRTLIRLCSQVLEGVSDSQQLLLLGIPTRGAALSRVLARELERELGHRVDQGVLDPTFHRDDLDRVGTRLSEATDLPVPIDGRHVVLVDDVVFTGRTVRAALEALHAWGRPASVKLLAMVDRGHRELPIQPDFVGRVVPTSRTEFIHLMLHEVDGEEGVVLLRPLNADD
jgi:pyrimidine operon attenuation protein/uracil phosphoribosyltransferase